MLRRAGRYFMTYSANHYAEPFYAIGYATAAAPLGPWTKPADNPLVASDEKLGVSGPGHSCIIPSLDSRELFLIYHTHALPGDPKRGRTVNIDRIVVEEGKLRVKGPTRSPQPLPSPP